MWVPGQPAELEFTLIIEADVTGALGQLFDNRGGQDLATIRLVGNARGQRDVLTAEVRFFPYGLAR